MSYDPPANPTLFELLARSWQLPTAVETACFNVDGDVVAFSSGGEIAMAALADPEAAAKRLRIAADTGRQTIQPRTKPIRAATRVGGVAGPIVPYGKKSFLTGSAKGGLMWITPRGQDVPLPAPLAGPVTALARDPSSAMVAAAAEAQLVILPDGNEAPPVRIAAQAPVTALAFSPDGGRLAVGHTGGVTFWQNGTWADHVALNGVATLLRFSPDGAFLACGLAEPGIALIRLADLALDHLPDYPTPTRSLDWSRPGRAVATSGAFRAAAWSMTAEGRGAPLEAGRRGLVIVDRLAASPDRPLLAVGYASGLLCLAQLGAKEELLLQPEGPAISALAWSPDGSHLAVGDSAGGAALVAFPPSLFK